MPENTNPQQIPAPETNPAPAPSTEQTFTQSEVEAMIGKRLAKAMKGVPGEEELTAFRAWKESQQTEHEKWETLTKERDESRTALTEARAKIEQYEREKFLQGKGVPADDLDYYVFKIGRMVTEDVTFEKAAEKFLAEKAPSASAIRVDFSAPLNGGKTQQTPNEAMNNLIRGARK